MTAQNHAIRGVEVFGGKQNKYDFVSDFKNYGLIMMSFSFLLAFFLLFLPNPNKVRNRNPACPASSEPIPSWEAAYISL